MFETQGRTRNRTRDLPKKGSAFILSSDHWTSVQRSDEQYGDATIGNTVQVSTQDAGARQGTCSNRWRKVARVTDVNIASLDSEVALTFACKRA